MQPMVDVAPQPGVVEQLLGLPKTFAQRTEFQTCVQSLRNGEAVTFDSVWGSSCALLMAALATQFDRLLVVVEDARSLDNLLDDLPTFFDKTVERFPSCLTDVNHSVTVDLEYGDRLRLIKALSANDAGPIIVTTVPALLQPVPSKDAVQSQSRRLAVGDRIDLAEFRDWLIEQGFHQTTAVELPGEFSGRGGIFDVFAPDWAGPIRIEFFDDEIESMRQFDGATQRSNADVGEIEITVLSPEHQTRGHLADFLAARNRRRCMLNRRC